ncbi:ligase-associated DNA damage response endonuclease PdeM [Empedobacter falsenii]|uniref:ligase-associated DNA damage response endonuclease PdeM n=1 Tax=Empedobacter falsenii TaxID=343874 RepID=UPI0006925347|nr:ligase-associated DNA damage response endonuclease PdeM [Empedobacter falsenii]
MYNPFEWSYHSTKIHFLPQKLMLLPEHKTLVIADWHLGKIEHFRKNGAFLPQVTSQKEYRLIQEFINQFNLKRIILLGDLFHSELNTDWFDFVEFLQINYQIEFILTKGNHDILPKAFYHLENLFVVKFYQIEDLIFTHEKSKIEPHQLNIIGHHHPGIAIKGRARQSYRLPCFYLENNILIMPAFGEMTGLYIYEKTNQNHIFPILGQEIIEYNP